MSKKMLVLGLVSASLLLANQALAHTTVKPASVGIGKFQTFTVSAPTEKEISTVGIRLVLPEGLNHVSPNVKPGWKVEIKKAMVGEEEKVTEIIWTGGSIPAEMRDEFNFSAQTPSKPTTLAWKAYQTYQDGTVVAWDQDPNAEKAAEHIENIGPYSKTEVIDDLTAPIETQTDQTTDPKIMAALGLSTLSLITALAAMRNKRIAQK